MRWIPSLALFLFLVPAPALAEAANEDAVLARDDRIADLERKLELLTDELSRVRDQVAVPEETELKSAYGLGPAASRIYGQERGLSIGGYGEFFYRNFLQDRGAASDSVGGSSISDRALDRADALRLVLYFGYKFSEKIVFNSEIEFEHAKTGSSSASAGSGTVAIEFATMDFFLHEKANARAGLVLLPMGFINEIHEPTTFHGVQRPETERQILPSTWREMGAGLFGQLTETIEYRAYAVTGFNAAGFSDSGIRGGRQNGNRSISEDVALVGRLDWRPAPEWMVGGSLYSGNSGQGQTIDGNSLPDSRLTIAEIHVQYRRDRIEARVLAAWNWLSDAEELNLALGRPTHKPIAEQMFGAYAELAYDLWPTFTGEYDKKLSPFLRVEYVDTQAEVPSGFDANGRNSYWLFTPGISFKPHPNVVLKLEYRNFTTRGEPRPDELAIGMGFAF